MPQPPDTEKPHPAGHSRALYLHAALTQRSRNVYSEWKITLIAISSALYGKQLGVRHHCGGPGAVYSQNLVLGRAPLLSTWHGGAGMNPRQTPELRQQERSGLALGATSTSCHTSHSSQLHSYSFQVHCWCPDPCATRNHQVKLVFLQMCKPLLEDWEPLAYNFLCSGFYPLGSASLLKARAQILPKRHGYHMIYVTRITVHLFSQICGTAQAGWVQNHDSPGAFPVMLPPYL